MAFPRPIWLILGIIIISIRTQVPLVPLLVRHPLYIPVRNTILIPNCVRSKITDFEFWAENNVISRHIAQRFGPEGKLKSNQNEEIPIGTSKENARHSIMDSRRIFMSLTHATSGYAIFGRYRPFICKMEVEPSWTCDVPFATARGTSSVHMSERCVNLLIVALT